MDISNFDAELSKERKGEPLHPSILFSLTEKDIRSAEKKIRSGYRLLLAAILLLLAPSLLFQVVKAPSVQAVLFILLCLIGAYGCLTIPTHRIGLDITNGKCSLTVFPHQLVFSDGTSDVFLHNGKIEAIRERNQGFILYASEKRMFYLPRISLSEADADFLSSYFEKEFSDVYKRR